MKDEEIKRSIEESLWAKKEGQMKDQRIESLWLKIEEVVASEHDHKVAASKSHELEENLIKVKTEFADAMLQYENDRNQQVKANQMMSKKFSQRLTELVRVMKQSGIDVPRESLDGAGSKFSNENITPKKAGRILRKTPSISKDND